MGNEASPESGICTLHVMCDTVFSEGTEMPTIIFNCKKCKIGKRVEYPIERSKGYFYRLDSNGHEQPAGVWVTCSGGGRPTEYGGMLKWGFAPVATRRWTTTAWLPAYRLTTSAMLVAYTLAALTVSVHVVELTTGKDGAR